MAQGGAGLGRAGAYVIFVPGALPGEQVRVRLRQRKPRYAHAELVAHYTSAPERVAPRLPAADHIPWQHIAYPAQLGYKQAIVREQLSKLAGLTAPPVAAPLPAGEPWGYRNTARLHIAAASASPADCAIGYHASGTRTVRDLPTDPLLLPALNEALHGLRRALLSATRLHARTVTLRGSGAYGYAVGQLDGPRIPAALRAAWCDQVPALAGVAADDAPATLHEALGGVVFALAPGSFFQTHTAQAEVLLATLRTLLALAPHETLLDAYSGVGAFALPLARDVHRVLAIEEHTQAVHDGQQSAALNGIDNVTFTAAPVERALATLDVPIDVAILDPPRRGCHPAALEGLLALAPTRIAYVSCHPAILARDLRPLMAGGYTLQQVQLVDMFPQTPHIECVALLARA